MTRAYYLNLTRVSRGGRAGMDSAGFRGLLVSAGPVDVVEDDAGAVPGGRHEVTVDLVG